MNVEKSFKNLSLTGDVLHYSYINVFKNPNKLPINLIHLEKVWYEIKSDIPKDVDITNLSKSEKYIEKKIEVLPALDKRWLPKCILYKFEPYSFTLSKEENESFITKNILYMESLEYLLHCNYHHFWCTILFEPSAAVSLRSFILNPILPNQYNYLEDQCSTLYKTIFNLFFLVYNRLITFKVSDIEYMPKDFGFLRLIERKLINLPVVLTLAVLYKSSNIPFVNRLSNLYFEDMLQVQFQRKEVEETINQTIIILEMIEGYLCGFEKGAVIVPISIPNRPPVFSIEWVYSIVNYLLNSITLINTLLELHKPAVEIALEKQLPFRIPYIYVTIYRELYEMLYNREELKIHGEMTEKIFDEINLGRSEFVNAFHIFNSYCLDKTLEYMGDEKQQEHMVEIYLKLINMALEEEYFICDYDMTYNVANQNEMFESCTNLDKTRTEFIVSCINRLSRHKKLEQLSNLKKETIEDVFKRFKPPELEEEPIASTSEQNSNGQSEGDIEAMIKDIIDMFPHLGDGFILKCLETYNYKSSDVINAILEENLPPHLYDTPFDSIRIPPDPQILQPMVAYTGKKPEYDDALKLLNDKKDIKKIKEFVLEGVQYDYDYIYDDEYDDRYDDDIPIKVADNPVEELLTFNPNHEELASDTSYSSDEYDDEGKPLSKSELENKDSRTKINFCEDPAKIREKREAMFQSKGRGGTRNIPKKNVVGKPKGQGQDKGVLKARENKNIHKSSRANHNRKGGAQWKRTRGMIPS